MVFPKEFFEKVDFEKSQQMTKKNMQNYLVGKVLTFTMLYMGLDGRKPVFSGLRTTKTQTSLRIGQTDQHLCH